MQVKQKYHWINDHTYAPRYYIAMDAIDYIFMAMIILSAIGCYK